MHFIYVDAAVMNVPTIRLFAVNCKQNLDISVAVNKDFHNFHVPPCVSNVL